jgi:hypothetical protein
MQELRLINAAEYIGALSDFTGEIGRLAVMHAGKRDFQSVRYVRAFTPYVRFHLCCACQNTRWGVCHLCHAL